jgi:hypothetical protein
MVDTPVDIITLHRYDRTTVSLCEPCSKATCVEEQIVEGTIREEWDDGRGGVGGGGGREGNGKGIAQAEINKEMMIMEDERRRYEAIKNKGTNF